MAVEVSIIVPIKDECDPYIDRCLESLKNLNYSSPFEILVIKGGNRAQARNFGIKIAKGEIIAFMDSDCMAPKEWLSLLVNNLKRDATLGGVGGVNVSPSDDSIIGKTIDFVFSSYLGSLGSASLHQPSKPKFVTALACINSAFWHRILMQVGGFDEEFEVCEDTNLGYKVGRMGYKLLLAPWIFVWHYRRGRIKQFAKQFFLYGMGRMRSILTSKNYANKSIIIPFVGAVLFPMIIWLFPCLALIIFTIYLIAIFLKGLQAAKEAKESRFLLLVPLLFATEHFTYLLGMIYGITKGKWKRNEGFCEVFHSSIIKR